MTYVQEHCDMNAIFACIRINDLRTLMIVMIINDDVDVSCHAPVICSEAWHTAYTHFTHTHTRTPLELLCTAGGEGAQLHMSTLFRLQTATD